MLANFTDQGLRTAKETTKRYAGSTLTFFARAML